MPRNTKPKPIECEVYYSLLAWLLEAVIPHAAPAHDAPVLHSVRLTSRDGYLYATATDRYTLGRARIRGAEDKPVPDGIAVTVPLDAAKQILRLFKPGRRERAATVTLAATAETIHVAGRAGAVAATWAAGLPTYPDLERLFPRRDSLTLATDIALNPKYVARFAKVGGGEPMRVTAADGDARAKMAHVRIGEDFAGVIIGVVRSGETWALGDWADAEVVA